MRQFISNHIKLITFLVTISLFLAAFLPIAYYESKDYFVLRGDRRPEMTTGDLILLADAVPDGTLKLEHFTKYKGEEINYEDNTFTYYTIKIEPCYRVMVGFNNNTKTLIYFTVLDSEADSALNVLEGVDLRAYFASKG